MFVYQKNLLQQFAANCRIKFLMFASIIGNIDRCDNSLIPGWFCLKLLFAQYSVFVNIGEKPIIVLYPRRSALMMDFPIILMAFSLDLGSSEAFLSEVTRPDHRQSHIFLCSELCTFGLVIGVFSLGFRIRLWAKKKRWGFCRNTSQFRHICGYYKWNLVLI